MTELNATLPVLLFGAAMAASLILTHLVRQYAISRSIVDVPNGRSLHERPVPRGGGLAVVVTVLTGMVLLAIFGSVPANWAIAVVGGGAAVALVGWLDDRQKVTGRGVRALVHFAGAGWALWWLGGLPLVSLGSASLALPVAGTLLAAVGMVWWTNLYNFMDGIDGLAGGQAVTVASAAGVLMILTGSDTALALPAFLVAGAAAGFLVLNWSPARIFMGDVGSGFLGFVFATLAIATENAGALPLLVWVLLSGAFLFDATVTLLRRTLGGERWYEAHRVHAYQRLVTAGASHAFATAAILVVSGMLAMVAYHVAVEGDVASASALAIAVLASLYLSVEHLKPMRTRRAGRRTPDAEQPGRATPSAHVKWGARPSAPAMRRTESGTERRQA
jgi:Fuc2NAc and GlcNAc transferase